MSGDARNVLERSMLEDDLLTTVMGLLRIYRWMAYHVRNSKAAVTQGDAGFPDIIACRPPRLIVVELKREGKVPTVMQEQWLRAFHRVGGIEVFVWWPRDLTSGRIERALA